MTRFNAQRGTWNIPLIFQCDKVPVHGKLFIDVEKVTLKIVPPQTKHEAVGATVGIVNEAKTLVLWAYIAWPKRQVCQYFS